MSDKSSIFSRVIHSIIPKGMGNTAEGVTSNLTDLYNYGSSGKNCYICSQPAPYKLVPKDASGVYGSAWLEDNGYVCEHCLKTHINSEQYRVKELR